MRRRMWSRSVTVSIRQCPLYAKFYQYKPANIKSLSLME
jgi:hypothetical protein